MSGNHLAMSDEDFLNQPLPETGEASSVASDDNTQQNAEQAQEQEKAPEENAETPAETPSDEAETPDTPVEGGDQPAGEEPKPEAEEQPSGEPKPDAAPTGSEAKPDPKPADGGTGTQESQRPDAGGLAAFYDKMMAPFTANGKEIKLKNPEEAIQLMQMGANYTRKMQELAPHRKIMTMLSNNQLLSEDKLSFLIDLDKGDKEAIKKFIKDKGIDPLDIDTTTEPAYREGSHRVTDQEVAFKSQLEELSSSPQGYETLNEIEKTWDQSSKDMLWDHPETLAIIHSQRENGIYAKITGEMDRLRTLGQLKPETPFVKAYQEIGAQLHAAGAFDGLGSAQADTPAPVVTDTPAPKPEPVATRAATPKPDANAAKAAAAAPTRAAPKTATEVPNFLSMSDDEFLKSDHFKGRV